mmetsp:Transcript_51568/g.144084  ORF Transcript_51568/g.144084 Transcript_51568/m.144084 type:complete len:650 (-) Transcript_51568:341-2290(-)
MAKSLNLNTQRVEAAATEQQAEFGRLCSARERRQELDALASSREDHLRQVDGAMTARGRITQELRNVRGQVQAKLLAARAKGIQDSGIADRALARAGRQALDAKLEADHWRTVAAEEDARQRKVRTDEERHLAKMRWAWDSRINDVQARNQRRVDLAQHLVEHTDMTSEKTRQNHATQMSTTVAHAERAASLQMANARTAQDQARCDVQGAVKQSTRSQLASVREVQQSRDHGIAKVAIAEAALGERVRECRSDLEQEMVCSMQARTFASTLCEQSDRDRHAARQTLEAKLHFTGAQAERKGANYQEELDIARKRNEIWDVTAAQSAAAGGARSVDERARAVAQVDEAKASLATIQVQLATYIRSVLDEWEEAKRKDAVKVEKAVAQTEALRKQCDETLQECRKLWAERLAATQRSVAEKKAELSAKVAEMEKLSDHRVEMMARQAREWREHADRQLADFQKAIEETRVRMAERVAEEVEASAQKIRNARESHDERCRMAAKRTAEAEARRDQARADFATVMARIRGAAMEARRRGLDNIAYVIEPPDCVGLAWKPPDSGAGAREAAAVHIQKVQRGNAARKEAAGKEVRQRLEVATCKAEEATCFGGDSGGTFNQTGSTVLPAADSGFGESKDSFFPASKRSAATPSR